MSRNIKRVVTGIDSDGQSKALSVEDLSPTLTLDAWPGVSATELWYSDTLPIDLSQPHCLNHSDDFDLPKEATRFLLFHLPPIEPMFREHKMLETLSEEELKKYGYHRTQTLDYAVVISGEVTLILDDEDHLLKAGDCVVQKGAMHTWHNRSDSLCVIAFVMIGSN